MSENQRIEFGQLPVEERIKSFRDFTIPLNDDEVHAQSLRCLHCGTPFCSNFLVSSRDTDTLRSDPKTSANCSRHFTTR